jgi:hypothetical protein
VNAGKPKWMHWRTFERLAAELLSSANRWPGWHDGLASSSKDTN